MNRYRFYVFDGSTAEEIREFPATNDETAVKIASGWRDNQRAELWCGERQVKRWRQGQTAESRF